MLPRNSLEHTGADICFPVLVGGQYNFTWSINIRRPTTDWWSCSPLFSQESQKPKPQTGFSGKWIVALGPRTQISWGMASLCLLLFGFMAPTVLYTNTFHKSTFFLLTVRYILKLVLPLFFSGHIQLPRQGKCHISRNMNADGFL